MCVDMDGDNEYNEKKKEFNKWIDHYLPVIFWTIFWSIIGYLLAIVA